MFRLRFLTAALFALAAMVLTAQEQPIRPVLSAYTLRAGSAHTVQTYLSPLRYSGQSFSLDYERMQAMRFNPDNWIMRLHGDLSMAHTRNPARNRTMWNLSLQLDWGMARRWRPAPRWTLFAGGFTALDGGVFYNASNGNNPAAAQAAWNVGVWGGASRSITVGKVPVCLMFTTHLPVAGIFFSPEYGELYYEIYLGNRRNLVRGAWPGNFIRWHNCLTADLRLGSAALRVGYAFNLESTKASHIVTRRIAHMAIVGVTSEWIALSPFRRISAEDRIINALY